MILSHEIYGKTTIICLAGRNFSWHKTRHFKPKTCAAGRADNIELLMLVLDFVMNSRLKILDGVSVESLKCLNKDA